jgi:hypothetical protein
VHINNGARDAYLGALYLSRVRYLATPASCFYIWLGCPGNINIVPGTRSTLNPGHSVKKSWKPARALVSSALTVTHDVVGNCILFRHLHNLHLHLKSSMSLIFFLSLPSQVRLRADNTWDNLPSTALIPKTSGRSQLGQVSRSSIHTDLEFSNTS